MCEDCKKADNLLSKIIGLIFCNDKKKNILFIFTEEKKHPIHSFFVPYSFSAVYLDKDMKVTEIFRVKPNERYVSNIKPAKYLLESYNLNYVPKVGERFECSGGKS